jgi:hypothetical protein
MINFAWLYVFQLKHRNSENDMKQLLLLIFAMSGLCFSEQSFAYEECTLEQINDPSRDPNDPQVAYASVPTCHSYAGAVAVDPGTRELTSAWSYEDDTAALNYVKQKCGKECIAVSFFENWVWIAISEDDNFHGISFKGFQDAISICEKSGGLQCDSVVFGSSAQASQYMTFGALAYDVVTSEKASVSGYGRRSSAEKAVKQKCNTTDCQVFTFQSDYFALAKSADGKLLGEGSNESERKAKKAAEKKCKQETNSKKCEIVVTGVALSKE